jgi:hypothetical protein
MKITSNKINDNDIELLKTLIGKKLIKIIHEPFTFSPTSYGIVYLNINSKNYIFTDYQESIDYFLGKEDISKIKFKKYDDSINSSIIGIDFVKENINQKITKITIVNSEQKALYKLTNEEYTFLDTQAIIFTLEDDYNLCLIKDDFCESITIYKGYDISSEIKKIETNLDNCYNSNLIGTSKISLIEL